MKPAVVLADTDSSRRYFLFALALLNIPAFTLLLCGVGFFLHLTVSFWQFPLACAAALIVHFFGVRHFLREKGIRFFWTSGAALLAVVGVLIGLSGLVYDTSIDGQWYHQETVLLLKSGYNPVNQQADVLQDDPHARFTQNWCTGVDRPFPSVTEDSLKNAVDLKTINVNNFAKGVETIEAAVYGTTGRIETGKGINWIILLGAFCLCLSLLYKIDRVSPRRKWCLAALFAFNPVLLLQANSFCVDGVLGAELLCLFVVFALLTREVDRYYLILLASVLITGVNVKFTGMIFIAMFYALFLLALWVNKKKETFRKLFITGAVCSFVALLCCGFNPYVTNIVNKHDLFYGLTPTRAEIKRDMPPLFQNLNSFQKLFFSLAAHQGWHSADKNSLWEIPKVPFTLNKEDLRLVSDPQQELSTFGPFFGGTLILAAILFIIGLASFGRSKIMLIVSGILMAIAFSVCIISESWWGRFVPQFWLVPGIILIMAELMTTRLSRVLKTLLELSLWLNIAWASMNTVDAVFTASRINYQMAQMRALPQPVPIELCPFGRLRSNLVRLSEANVPVQLQTVSGPYVYNIVRSSTRFETGTPLPDLPKSWLVNLALKFSGGEIVQQTQGALR